MKDKMRHMQGDHPFATIKDLCSITNKKYAVKKTRKMSVLSMVEKLVVPSLVIVK
jgi:hypothetical protein